MEDLLEQLHDERARRPRDEALERRGAARPRDAARQRGLVGRQVVAHGAHGVLRGAHAHLDLDALAEHAAERLREQRAVRERDPGLVDLGRHREHDAAPRDRLDGGVAEPEREARAPTWSRTSAFNAASISRSGSRRLRRHLSPPAPPARAFSVFAADRLRVDASAPSACS